MLNAMTLLGLGTDIVETARIKSSILRHGEAFLERVFTEEEIAYCAAMRDPHPYYAARFAAKEAVAKAFGTGLGSEAAFREIGVCRRDTGEPYIVLTGTAAATAERLGVREIRVSLSHTESHAVASALTLGV
jgi:holo-[acyl-carrier protein] synthase